MTAEPIETRDTIRRQQHLDAAATSARATAIATRQALSLLPTTPENQAGMRGVYQAVVALREIGEQLDLAGAIVPEDEARKRAADSASLLDLSMLATLADPEAERLLAMIEAAQEVAERIDARRGRALPEGIALQPGESRGTDLAELLSTISLRLRLDLHGPTGKD